MTDIHDHTEITRYALTLGIALTSARPDSEMYGCWADRVLGAWSLHTRLADGSTMSTTAEHTLRDMIQDASNHAI